MPDEIVQPLTERDPNLCLNCGKEPRNNQFPQPITVVLGKRCQRGIREKLKSLLPHRKTEEVAPPQPPVNDGDTE